MVCKTQKFFFEAGLVRFGREHCRSIVTVADSSDNLNETYFDLNSQDPSFENETQYFVWFNTGAGTEPVVAGKTGIEVAINTDDTAEAVATALETAIEALATDDFRAAVKVGSPSKVEIGNRFGGAITAETDSGATGFTLAVETVGIGGALGKTADGIELALGTETGDVTTNQTGSIINAQIYQGQTAEVTASFVELDTSKLRALFAVIGDELQDTSDNYLIGGGESKLFQDLSVIGGQLVVHPQRLALTDYSRDLVLWSSAPKPDSLNFDGSALQQISTSFTGYVDDRYKQKINLYAIGPWTEKATVDA